MEDHEAFGELVKRVPGYLDRPIEELVKMSAVGSVYLSTHQALLRKIKGGQIGLAEEDRKTKLAEGQAIGRALLDVEARIGELLPSGRETERGPVRGLLKGHGGRFEGKLPEGIERHRLKNSRAIAGHPEAVAQVIAEAKENEDIPTKTAVLNKIALNKERGRREEGKQVHITSLSTMRADEQRYLTDLLRVVNLISDPPKELTQEGAKRIADTWRVIGLKVQKFLQYLEESDERIEIGSA